MSQLIKSFGQGDPALTRYALETFLPEDPILVEVRSRSAAAGLPTIQVGAMDGLHLEVITRAIGAKHVIEVGCLGGYSAICIARGLVPGGRLVSCELYEHNAQVARESFRRAGLDQCIEVVTGDARESLVKLAQPGHYDLVFLDADKESYPVYLDWARKNLRPGGVLLADNTFAWGLVVDDSGATEQAKRDAQGIREFNATLAQDSGWRATILPTGEGLTMAVRI